MIDARSSAEAATDPAPETSEGFARRTVSVLVVAAVVVEVVLVTAMLALRDYHDSSAVAVGPRSQVLGEPHDYLVPGWLPEGVVLETGSLRGPAPSPTVTGTVGVHGDPDGYRGNALGPDELGGLTLQYVLPGGETAETDQRLEITQRPGTADELDLFPVRNHGASATTVLGQPGWATESSVELFDPGSGLVVTISWSSLLDDPQTRRSFLDHLRPATTSEVEQLVQPFRGEP